MVLYFPRTLAPAVFCRRVANRKKGGMTTDDEDAKVEALYQKLVAHPGIGRRVARASFAEPSTRVLLFLEGAGLPLDERSEDAQRRAVAALMASPERSAVLTSLRNRTCACCRRRVERALEATAAQVVLAELRSRTVQVKRMWREGHLGDRDVKRILRKILAAGQLLERHREGGLDVRQSFRLVVDLINEIMLRFTAHYKK